MPVAGARWGRQLSGLDKAHDVYHLAIAYVPQAIWTNLASLLVSPALRLPWPETLAQKAIQR